jgi:hypothetical protein
VVICQLTESPSFFLPQVDRKANKIRTMWPEFEGGRLSFWSSRRAHGILAFGPTHYAWSNA